jgi:hypothetical protein
MQFMKDNISKGENTVQEKENGKRTRALKNIRR